MDVLSKIVVRFPSKVIHFFIGFSMLCSPSILGCFPLLLETAIFKKLWVEFQGWVWCFLFPDWCWDPSRGLFFFRIWCVLFQGSAVAFPKNSLEELIEA